MNDIERTTLDDRLAGAAGDTPTWRPFTPDAMQAVRRRAARRQAIERAISVACGLLVIALATTTMAALRPDDEDGARTVRTAEQPSEPSHDENDPLVDPSTTTSTMRPSFYFDGSDPGVHARAEVTASSPVVTFPPLATPTTGPTPSTTAPPIEDGRPPTAFAALNGNEVEALQGPNCWQRNGTSTCASSNQYWFADAPVIDGIQSGSLWFRWAVNEQPTQVTATTRFPTPEAEPKTVPCEGGNPCRIDFGVFSFGTDPTWIVIETHWEHGSVSHAVKVRSHPVEP